MRLFEEHTAPADESGAETVEFAIALPILIVTALCAIQLVLLGFQAVALEKQTVSGAWSVSATELASTDEPEELMAEAICDGGVLSADQLEISNMEVTTDTTSKDGSLSGKTVYARVNGAWTPLYSSTGADVAYTASGSHSGSYTVSNPNATVNNLTWAQMRSKLESTAGVTLTGDPEADAKACYTSYALQYSMDMATYYAKKLGYIDEDTEYALDGIDMGLYDVGGPLNRANLVKVYEACTGEKYTDDESALKALVRMLHAYRTANGNSLTYEKLYQYQLEYGIEDLAEQVFGNENLPDADDETAEMTSIFKDAYAAYGVEAAAGGAGTGSGSASDNAFREYVADRGTCSASFDVTYSLADLVGIPGMDALKVTRHIECTLIDHNRAEVK